MLKFDKYLIIQRVRLKLGIMEERKDNLLKFASIMKSRTKWGF